MAECAEGLINAFGMPAGQGRNMPVQLCLSGKDE